MLQGLIEVDLIRDLTQMLSKTAKIKVDQRTLHQWDQEVLKEEFHQANHLMEEMTVMEIGTDHQEAIHLREALLQDIEILTTEE